MSSANYWIKPGKTSKITEISSDNDSSTDEDMMFVPRHSSTPKILPAKPKVTFSTEPVVLIDESTNSPDQTSTQENPISVITPDLISEIDEMPPPSTKNYTYEPIEQTQISAAGTDTPAVIMEGRLRSMREKFKAASLPPAPDSTASLAFCLIASTDATIPKSYDQAKRSTEWEQ